MPRKRKPRRGDYEVGNCKPPKEHQFRKDQPSPNPSGRPPGSSKNRCIPTELNLVNKLLIEAGQKPIKTTRGGRVEEIPRITAAMEKLAAMGLGGSFPALKKFIEGSEAAYEKEAEFQRELLEVAIRYKEKWGPIFDSCIKRGLPVPNQLPDPRDVVIDGDGTVDIVGAVTAEMKEEQDEIQRWRDGELQRLNWAQREDGLDKIFPDLPKKLSAMRRRIAKCNAYLPPRLRRLPESPLAARL